MNKTTLSKQELLANQLATLSRLLISRKNDTGNYYLIMSNKVSNANTTNKLNSLIEELVSSSGKIPDLAGFNYNEDLALQDILITTNELMSGFKLER
jgi:hypothetical protein